MSRSPRLKLALIGLGPGARPHLLSLADLHDQLEVSALVCRSPDLADCGPFDRGLLTADLDAVLSDVALKAVIIATPPATHLELAGKCLAAGKAVLLEKPLEISLERAGALVALADHSGLTFGVMLQHRLRDGALRLAELLAKQALGEIVTASVMVPWWRPQSYYDVAGRGTFARDGGGVLLTQAIHTLDLFRHLTGPLTVEAAQAVTTSVHQMEGEDHVHALLKMQNGAPVMLMASTAAYPGSSEQIALIGTKGAASLIGGRLEVNWHDGRKEVVEADGRSGGGANIMDFSHEPHRAVISDFITAVKLGSTPAISGHEALATHRLIDDILAAAKFSQTPTINLNHKEIANV